MFKYIQMQNRITKAENGTSASLVQNGLLSAVSCGILFAGKEFKDESGCLKKEGHNNSHIFKTDDGRLIEWEDDYKCKCGCWNDEDLVNVCKTYKDLSVLSKDEAILLMKQGERVTHRYFSNDEWITMLGNIIRMETGQECWASEFWRDRQGAAWETDWSLYGG